MARLELPVRAFVEDFLARSFPNRTFARGTAINDLVVKPMSVLLQPLRHDIDAMKVGQSLLNYQYLSRDDMDGLAANFGAFRQSGGRSEGTITLYFDTAADYRLDYLEFVGQDGTVFTLAAPVTISSLALLRSRATEGGQILFAYDVQVVSVGIGSRYAVAANTVTTIRNPPANLVRCTNKADFTITAPDETNLDVANAIFRNFGLKNRVSRQAIRSSVYDTFPGVLDVFVAGTGHPKMVRDLVTIPKDLDGHVVSFHAGSMSDVWVNTTNLRQATQIFSYLPSSREVRLLSAEQAAAQEVLTTFSLAYLSVDGEFSLNSTLDESMNVQFIQAALPVNTTVLAAKSKDVYRLAASDIANGRQGFFLPAPTSQTGDIARYFVDYIGASWQTAGVAPGDRILLGSDYPGVTKASGRVVEYGLTGDYYNVSTGRATAHVAVVDSEALPCRRILKPATLPSAVAQPGDRVRVPYGPACGTYRVLGEDSSYLYVANTLASMTYVGSSFSSGFTDVTLSGSLPHDVGTSDWLVVELTQGAAVATTTGRDGALDVAAANWFPIVSVTRSGTTAVVRVTGNTTGLTFTAASVIRGLNGTLGAGDSFYLETDTLITPSAISPLAASSIDNPYANVLATSWPTGTKTVTGVRVSGSTVSYVVPGHGYVVGQWVTINVGDTSYNGTWRITSVPDAATFSVLQTVQGGYHANQSSIPDPSGSNSTGTCVADVLYAVGVGAFAAAGDLAIFDGTGYVPDAVAASQGGDGSKHSLVVTPITHSGVVLPDLVRVSPPLNVTIPAGTRFALQRNGTAYGTKTVSGTAGSVVTVTGWNTGVSGLGDGVGMVVKPNTESAYYTVQASSLVLTRTLTFAPAKQARNITFSAAGYIAATAADIGQAVSQVLYSAPGIISASYNGILVAFDNSTRVWTVVPNNYATDIFAVDGTYSATVAGTNRGGLVSSIAAFAGGPGATNAWGYWTPSATGVTVTQGSYTGTLVSYGTDASGNPTWQVAPATDSDIFDSTTAYTYIGTNVQGSPRGVLLVPASDVGIDTGSGAVSLTLDRALASSPATVSLYPRYGRKGGLFDGSTFRLSTLGSASSLASVLPTSQASGAYLLPLLGANVDLLSVTAFTASTAVAAGDTECVSIPHSPGVFTFTAAGTLAAGYTGSIPIAGSRLGFWAAPGRVLRVFAAGSSTPMLLETNGRGATDNDVVIVTPLPSQISASQTYTAEIVEGFVTPFMVPATAGVQPYRITRLPVVGEVLSIGSAGNLGTDGTYAGTSSFSTTTDLRSSYGLNDSELHLNIDSGPGASLDQFDVLSFSSSTTMTLDRAINGSASDASYHLTRRPVAQKWDRWYTARFPNVSNTGANITLYVDFGADVPLAFQFGCGSRVGVFINLAPSTAGGTIPAAAAGTLMGPFQVTSVARVGTTRLWAVTFYPVSSAETGYNYGAGAGSKAALCKPVNIAGAFVTGASGVNPLNAALTELTVRVSFRLWDRSMARQMTAAALNTYSYYSGGFMTLPVVRVASVDLLSSDAATVLRPLEYSLLDANPGLRYSAKEQVTLVVTDPEAALQPIRVTYVADPSISTIDSFLNDPDTAVLNSNQLAKRMETITINVSGTIRSEKTASEVNTRLTQFINTQKSTIPMSKDRIVQFLYSNGLVSAVDVSSLVLGAVYVPADGATISYTDTPSVFGAETACYVAGSVTLSRLGN